jgi:hypothetical protein
MKRLLHQAPFPVWGCESGRRQGRAAHARGGFANLDPDPTRETGKEGGAGPAWSGCAGQAGSVARRGTSRVRRRLAAKVIVITSTIVGAGAESSQKLA